MGQKKNLILAALLVIFSLVAFVGCNYSAKTTEEQAKEIEIETVSIVHQLGEVTVEKNPERVIVFDYATLDSLNQMNVEIIGLPKSHIPDYLSRYRDAKYEDVGTLFEPNYEKIYELQPDLILISARQRDLYTELAKLAPTVYLTIDTQDYIGSLGNNLKVLGEIFGKENFVKDEVAKIEAKINNISSRTKASNKKALIVLANDGALSAFGLNSRFNVIHKEFGFSPADENIEVSNHGQSISFEYILEVDPDIIFVVDRAAVTGGSNAAQNVLDNDLVKMTKAFKNDEIHYLNAHVWYVASGGLEGTKIMVEEIEAVIQ
ncbi:MAG: siderophore ABC transporter substrate-binding protein [Clostridiales bacterium]|jgi:iron complex transport system substrate-binding protein|nr:siderophore ABC transporter substrate-binding protein [Clostridiales bacterium]